MLQQLALLVVVLLVPSTLAVCSGEKTDLGLIEGLIEPCCPQGAA